MVGSEKGNSGHHSNLCCLPDSQNIYLNIYICINVYSFPTHAPTRILEHHTHTHTPLSLYLQHMLQEDSNKPGEVSNIRFEVCAEN